jgi:NADH-quinone oxidoreductase subunit A
MRSRAEPGNEQSLGTSRAWERVVSCATLIEKSFQTADDKKTLVLTIQGLVCETFHKVACPQESAVANYLPILIYLIAVIGFAAVSIILPQLVAPRRPTRVKDMPYESGMDPVGDARKPFDIKFYLIAILFLVFDIELLFVYPWAVSLLAPDGVPQAFRPAVLAVLLVLMATLGLAYMVAYCKGVFDWRRK